MLDSVYKVFFKVVLNIFVRHFLTGKRTRNKLRFRLAKDKGFSFHPCISCSTTEFQPEYVISASPHNDLRKTV